MSRLSRGLCRLAPVLFVPSALFLVSCGGEGGGAGPSDPIGFSRAYGIWTPSAQDTCTAEIHNSYSVVGPDGKLYPTWHPPVDPATGCTFGHEHGRDPRGSKLYAQTGPIPLGYANEQLDIANPNMPRHEDHVGHKVEWENDMNLSGDGGVGQVLSVRCDVLVKMHQGTHSKDAFTNNMHEMVYAIQCNEGTAFHVTLMTVVGRAGEMVRGCETSVRFTVGTATPPNSPNGGGERRIPDRTCVERFMLTPPGQRSQFQTALRENWETSNSVRTESGKTLVSFNPYIQALFPSRFFDPNAPGQVGRPIDVCYETTADGRTAQGGECEASTSNGAVTGLTYDDPRSLFNGVRRFVDINSNNVSNEDGPTVWYSDPLGKNAKTQPFAGSIRQFIAKKNNAIGVLSGGPQIGRNRNYGGPGVHAPN